MAKGHGHEFQLWLETTTPGRRLELRFYAGYATEENRDAALERLNRKSPEMRLVKRDPFEPKLRTDAKMGL